MRFRVLNDAQVQRVLLWNIRLQTFKALRKRVPTLRDFARDTGIAEKTLLRWLPTIDEKIRLLIRIRSWGRAQTQILQMRSELDTLRGLAREFGVSDSTIQDAVRRKGFYKHVSPELVSEARSRRQARIERLKRKGLY